MKKLFKLIPLTFVFLVGAPLTACTGNIDDYVGVCTVDTSYERTYRYSYGSRSTLEDHEVSGIPCGATITIKQDKTVVFNYPNGDMEVTGKLAFYFDQVYFRNLNFSNDYKFSLTNNGQKKLIHSYSENKHGLEYTEKSRYIVLIYKS